LAFPIEEIKWWIDTFIYPTWYTWSTTYFHVVFFVLANLCIVWTSHYKSPKWIFLTCFPIFHQLC
jgi:hypothetical protein